jgi:hypothetical protein
VDLALVFSTPPRMPAPDRLPAAELGSLWDSLRAAGWTMRDGQAAGKALAELRELYEPFVNALATHFLFTLPPFRPDKPPVDNWQTSAWTPRSIGLAGLGAPPPPGGGDDHFD